MSPPTRTLARDLARSLVRLASWLVPPGERADWREEWEAEIAVLAARDTGATALLRFAAGALPAALAERTGRWSWAGTFQDVRVGLRGLARAPLFAAVAVGTLGLGIGANAALFSVVNGVLLRSVPGVADPERVVQIGRSYPHSPSFDNWSWPAFELFRAETDRVFTDVAGYTGEGAILGRGIGAARVPVELVTGSYFSVLGVRPALGRLIDGGDAEEGAPPVAVLSWATWRSRFGSDPGIVGSSVPVAGEPHTVVGVAPEGFVGVERVGSPAELWLPVSRWAALRGYPSTTPFEQWDWSWLSVIARLEPGATADEARDVIVSLAETRAAAMPWYFEDLAPVVATGVGLDPDGRREGRAIAGMLAAVGGLVLLITCANVANLLLARASTRSGEMGVRLALGAGRARLVRQLVAESAVLGGAGVLAALPFAWGAEALRPVLFPGEPGLDLSPDARVLAFTAGVGVLAVLLFGVLPALTGSRGEGVAVGLREARGGSGRSRLRSGLVVVQLALCLGLLTGAGSLLRSLWNARAADPGFDAERLLAVDVHFGHLDRYRSEGAPTELLARVRDRVLGEAGIEAATWAGSVPMADFQSSGTVRAADAPDGPEPTAELVVVGPDYFTTTGIALVRGREPTAEDLASGTPVAVVSGSLARLLWPDGTDPVGRTVDKWGPVRVIGVASDDVRLRGVGTPPRPTLWMSRDGGPVAPRRAALLVRTRGAPASVAPAVTRTAAAVDPELALVRTIDLRSALVRSLGETRTVSWLVGILAALALTLSAVGLFGVLAFTVERRRRELGIRTALGARPGELVGLVLRSGMTLAGVGVVLGLGVSWGVASGLRSLLYGVAPGDPTVTAATAGLLLGVAALAAWIPARRATKADAVACLREE